MSKVLNTYLGVKFDYEGRNFYLNLISFSGSNAIGLV